MATAPSSVPAARGPVAYGSYVDEVVAYQQTVNGVSTRYYPHYNHLYSVAALTNGAGQVVERYKYTAYGKQTITSPTGVVRQVSAVGYNRGFTGCISDSETGLLHARYRYYSPSLGRFVNRDLMPLIAKKSLWPSTRGQQSVNAVRIARYLQKVGWNTSRLPSYGSGWNLYAGYFAPNRLDPFGLAVGDPPPPPPPVDDGDGNGNGDGGGNGGENGYHPVNPAWPDIHNPAIGELIGELAHAPPGAVQAVEILDPANVDNCIIINDRAKKNEETPGIGPGYNDTPTGGGGRLYPILGMLLSLCFALLAKAMKEKQIAVRRGDL